jgi:hypothetical protein
VAPLGWEPTGVLSIDPVALQHLIGASTPVTFTGPDGEAITLTGANTASFLLSEIYARFPDPDTQDAVFAQTAQAVFTSLLDTATSPAALLDAVVRSAEEGRIQVWSANRAERELLAPTMLSGAMRGKVASIAGKPTPQAGVFLDLTSGSKMGYYLDHEVSVLSAETLGDGSQLFTIGVELTNVLPTGTTTYLPAYVIGNSPTDGSIQVNLSLFAPEGGQLLRVTQAGSELALQREQLFGLSAGVAHLSIPANTTLSLQLAVTSGPGQSNDLLIRTTPGPRSPGR